jgi:hypothetical protein
MRRWNSDITKSARKIIRVGLIWTGSIYCESSTAGCCMKPMDIYWLGVSVEIG